MDEDIKEQIWCNMCHGSEDCDDKGEFLSGDDETCPYFV